MRMIDLLGLLILAAIIVWQIKKPKLCDRCKCLCAKVGREYTCTRNPNTIYKNFTHAPSYCIYFEPREENTND